MRRPVMPKDEAAKVEWIDWQKVAQKTAIVSGAFCLILFILLVINHINLNQDDPLQTSQLEMLKEQLREDPNNDTHSLSRKSYLIIHFFSMPELINSPLIKSLAVRGSI